MMSTDSRQHEIAILRQWVYSVAMDITGSAWLRYRDSEIRIRDIDMVVKRIRDHKRIVSYILFVGEGAWPTWTAEMVALTNQQNEDDWFWFDSGESGDVPNKDFPTRSSSAFKLTAELLRDHLQAQLDAAPRMSAKAKRKIEENNARRGCVFGVAISFMTISLIVTGLCLSG